MLGLRFGKYIEMSYMREVLFPLFLVYFKKNSTNLH